MNKKQRYYEDSILISVPVEEVFRFVDDHNSFSSHMKKSSWMMGGGRMDIQIDKGKGQKVGSHIRLSGKILGYDLFLDEVVTLHEPPHKKVWQTVGNPKLLVVSNYKMGVEINPQDGKSELKVFIEYELPSTRWLGYLFGGVYAKWCVRQMIQSIQEHFNSS